jgi:hypothetical protein
LVGMKVKSMDHVGIGVERGDVRFTCGWERGGAFRWQVGQVLRWVERRRGIEWGDATVKCW